MMQKEKKALTLPRKKILMISRAEFPSTITIKYRTSLQDDPVTTLYVRMRANETTLAVDCRWHEARASSKMILKKKIVMTPLSVQ